MNKYDININDFKGRAVKFKTAKNCKKRGCVFHLDGPGLKPETTIPINRGFE